MHVHSDGPAIVLNQRTTAEIEEYQKWLSARDNVRVCIRIATLLLSELMVIAGIVNLIANSNKKIEHLYDLSNYILAMYVIIFPTILVLHECSQIFHCWMAVLLVMGRNFGFLFKPMGKAFFIIFIVWMNVGIPSEGGGGGTLIFLLVALFLILAGAIIFMHFRYPDIVDNMDAVVKSASIVTVKRVVREIYDEEHPKEEKEEEKRYIEQRWYGGRAPGRPKSSSSGQIQWGVTRPSEGAATRPTRNDSIISWSFLNRGRPSDTPAPPGNTSLKRSKGDPAWKFSTNKADA